MKNAFLLLISGILVTYLAVQLQLDIYVILTGISLTAVGITYGYLILVKRQYERFVIEGKLNNGSMKPSARSAA